MFNNIIQIEVNGNIKYFMMIPDMGYGFEVTIDQIRKMATYYIQDVTKESMKCHLNLL